MYTNIFFSEFSQTSLFETSVKTSAKSEKNTGFDSFLNKYQNSDFEFIKEASSQDSDVLKDESNLDEPNEEFISMLVEHMKEVLRNASNGSSFVSFSYAEITSLRKILVSSESLSMEEIETVLSSGKNNQSYLPDLFSSLENVGKKPLDAENVYFPFSFVPYFATALESIGVKPDDITSAIESSSDLEKGFSLEGFLDSLEEIKFKALENLEKLQAENNMSFEKASGFESFSSIIKGIETIEAVFELPKENNAVVNLDKNSLNKFLDAIETKLNSEISDTELYKKSLEASSNKQESEFVKNFFNADASEKEVVELTRNIFEQSFLSWKREQRVLSEQNLIAVQADYKEKLFEKSHEYSLFTSLPNESSKMEGIIANNIGLNPSFNEIFQASSVNGKFDFDLETIDGEDGDVDLKSLLKLSMKNQKKDSSELFSDEGSDFFDKSMSKNSAAAAKTSQANSSANLSKQIIEQVEKQVLRTVKLGQKEVSFRLNPPDLGRLHLKIESVRNGVNIKIIAEKGSTHEIMVQQAQEFKNQLQSQGMQVAEVNVELAQNFDQAMARERKNSFENNSKNRNISGVKGRNNREDNEKNSGIITRKMFFSDKAVDLMA